MLRTIVSGRSRKTRLQVEELEPRQLLSGLEPSVAAQLLLERLNDARENPLAYGNAIGLDLSYVSPSQPLAWSPLLGLAAQSHALDMSTRGYFSHTTPEGVTGGQRLTNVGFDWSAWGESIAFGFPSAEAALQALIVDAGVPNLGHRSHLLAIDNLFQSQNQIGIGIANASNGTPYYVIDTAANRDARPFVTGVVFLDANSNGRYDAGEGLGGATITVSGIGAFTTFSTGGYSIQLDPGFHTLTVSGAGLPGSIAQTVVLDSTNVRLNFNGLAVNNQPTFNSPAFYHQYGASDISQFLNGLYLEVLGRPADGLAIQVFQPPLEAARAQAHGQIATNFLHSTEYRTLLVEGLYATQLGRTASPSEVAGWRDHLQRGATAEQVMAALLGSEEFVQIHGNENWAYAVYAHVVGRAPDAAEYDSLLSQLGNGVSRTDLAFALLSGAEYQSNLTAAYYQHFLGRSPDEQELQGWVNRLQAGWTSLQVAHGFIASPEFLQSNGNSSAAWLASLYGKLLGREPNSAEYLGNLNALLSHYAPQRQTVITSLTRSVEYRTNQVSSYYHRFLGRAASPTEIAFWVSAFQQGNSAEQVMAGLIGSPEYYQRYGATNAGWLTATWSHLFQRPLDAVGLNTFLNQLNRLSRRDVALALLTSTEYRVSLIHSYYSVFLGTPAPQNDLNTWLVQLQRGMTQDQMLAGVLQSPEYFRRRSQANL